MQYLQNVGSGCTVENVPALQHFLEGERLRRGWSMDEFASRAKISLSNAYLILRDGKDNVRQHTLENLAGAYGLTPAELMIAIGKGTLADDPKRTPLYALVRQVPDDALETAGKVIQALTAPPIGATTRRRDGASTQRPGSRRVHDQRQRLGDDTGTQGGEPTVYRGVRAAFAHFSFTYILTSLQRLMPPTNGLSPQPAG